VGGAGAVRNFFSFRKQAAAGATPRAGFSLVELTIVVVLAGLLATMAVPRVSKSVENTHVNQGVADMQSLWLAQRRYRLISGEFAPSITELVQQGFVEVRPQEKIEPFQYSFVLRGSDGLRISAQRATGSGWSGELTLDELGRIGGRVISGGGHVVEP